MAVPQGMSASTGERWKGVCERNVQMNGGIKGFATGHRIVVAVRGANLAAEYCTSIVTSLYCLSTHQLLPMSYNSVEFLYV